MSLDIHIGYKGLDVSKAGIDVSDADALVTDVKAGKTFYSVAAPKKTGTLPTKAIVAGAETYEEGYHAGDPGGLSAIDTDLAAANVKKAVNIFGKVGTLAPVVNNSITRYRNLAIGTGDEWVIKGTDLVPAAATHILAQNWTTNTSASEKITKVRGVYNGVQKYIHDYVAATARAAYGEASFAGLGIEATLTLEHWQEYSTGPCGGKAYYLTM